MLGKSVEVQKLEAWVKTQWMIVKSQNKIESIDIKNKQY